jgi:hypothetical protein
MGVIGIDIQKGSHFRGDALNVQISAHSVSYIVGFIHYVFVLIGNLSCPVETLDAPETAKKGGAALRITFGLLNICPHLRRQVSICQKIAFCFQFSVCDLDDAPTPRFGTRRCSNAATIFGSITDGSSVVSGVAWSFGGRVIGRSRHWDGRGSTSAMWLIADDGGIEQPGGSILHQ